jgi:acyl transferase domain-containing protein/acyl carrier protein
MSDIKDLGSLHDVAIIAMAGRFPGADDVEQFWKNLRDGTESVSFFTNEELLESGVDPALLSQPNYVKAKATLSNVDCFDARFFGISPREAELMDPQQRIFLECAWSVLESAGYDAERYDGRIGIYAGVSTSTYLLNNLYSNQDYIGTIDDLQVVLGNDKDFLATQVSYRLNLKGPSITVQTACSTSLVTVHLACQSILYRECDMALAGGVSVEVPQKAGYLYERGRTVSPDGHCRPFDAGAQGTVVGSGVGIVVLKRLSDALKDGDTIHAVIKGSAINNDGARKINYVAPSEDGQVEVIAEALAVADVDAETITYVEAHGTGTALGDPIEVAALTRAFRSGAKTKRRCGLGSVKGNIGHLDAAAGVVSLIKTTLALKHKMIPPSLHFERPNPAIDFANSPFYISTELHEWKTDGQPRRAGVSSFGMGGTNVHVILEEAPDIVVSEKARPWHLLLLSAKTELALEHATKRLVEYLKQHPDLRLADVAYTLQVGRKTFDCRRALVCRDLGDAVTALETRDPKRVLTSIQKARGRSVVFMFPGLGDQYVDMAWGLYQTEPAFRGHIDLCSDFLRPYLGIDLRQVLFPAKDQAHEAGRGERDQSFSSSLSSLDLRSMLRRGENQVDEADRRLGQTSLAHPALFVIEYAMAQLLMKWGVCPQAMIGHSIGEYVAACLAGVFSLEDALALVAQRAQMIQGLPGGAMLAVPLPESEVQFLLGEELSLSAVNGSSLCVVAGSMRALAVLERSLLEQEVVCRRVKTSHAFHSKMMDPILEPFAELVRTIDLKPPRIPYVSNVTGTWITREQATDPNYWAKHLRQPVRFADGIRELWKESEWILLEVGPGQTLGSLAIQHPASSNAMERVVSTLRYSYDRRSDVAYLLHALGKLWLAGVHVDWPALYVNERPPRIPLPTYPFEHQRYWITPQKPEETIHTRSLPSERKLGIADWFYIPSWKRSLLPCPFGHRILADQKQHWLVLVDECGIGSQVVERLEQAGQDVTRVLVGDRFRRLGDQIYVINPRIRDDYNILFKELRALGRAPDRIVHLWSLKEGEDGRSGAELFAETQSTGFYSLLFLGQALGKQVVTQPLQVLVVSNGVHEVESGDVVHPERATLLGPCKVIPQEYVNIACRNIDIVVPESGSDQEKRLIDQLVVELAAESSDVVVAYRGNHRWVQVFEPIKFDGEAERLPLLREKGVYLITGGLGRIGLLMAEYLAKSAQARLVLTGRSGLPTPAEREQWLANHDEEDLVSARIKRVQRLEKLGAEVLVVSADVADEDQMRAVVAQTYDRFGKIDGLVHAAGIIDEEALTTISETDYAQCELHFQSKVYGLYVLDRVLNKNQEDLDFCLLVSSLSPVLGGIGFVAYASANVFMDAFAHKQNEAYHQAWVSVNWDGSETEEETMEAFRRILSVGPVTQIIFSTQDLIANIAKWVKLEGLREKQKQAEPALLLHLRPNLQNPYVAPRSEVERRIVNIWQELLGIEQVGIYDDFFELGGHSLVGTQVISRLRRDFQVDLALRILFEMPTAADLALVIEDLLIAEVEELTEEEAVRLIESDSPS